MSRRGRTPLWLPATSMAWIDSELSQPRIFPRQVYLSRAAKRTRSDTPRRPTRPHETRDRPIGVHARSYVTCQGGFRRLREDTRRVSPAAFVAEMMMTAIGISASVPSSRAATSIATTRRASLRVAASASPRPGAKPGAGVHPGRLTPSRPRRRASDRPESPPQARYHRCASCANPSRRNASNRTSPNP